MLWLDFRDNSYSGFTIRWNGHFTGTGMMEFGKSGGRRLDGGALGYWGEGEPWTVDSRPANLVAEGESSKATECGRRDGRDRPSSKA